MMLFLSGRSRASDFGDSVIDVQSLDDETSSG
jgi:hypothetical protein